MNNLFVKIMNSNFVEKNYKDAFNFFPFVSVFNLDDFTALIMIRKIRDTCSNQITFLGNMHSFPFNNQKFEIIFHQLRIVFCQRFCCF